MLVYSIPQYNADITSISEEDCFMYGINYNVFRIIGGMGSTVFSN
jgi:hypothetical protein